MLKVIPAIDRSEPDAVGVDNAETIIVDPFDAPRRRKSAFWLT
jgi:hypothetical protein